MTEKVPRTAQASVGTEAEREAARAELVRVREAVTDSGITVEVVFSRLKGGFYGSDDHRLHRVLNDTAMNELKKAGTPLTKQTKTRIKQKIDGKSSATVGKERKSAPTTDSPVQMARLTPASEVLLHSTPP
jgi:hypothetical protein